MSCDAETVRASDDLLICERNAWYPVRPKNQGNCRPALTSGEAELSGGDRDIFRKVYADDGGEGPPWRHVAAFLPQSCVNLHTDSGEKVRGGCGKMGKRLEGPKSHDNQPRTTIIILIILLITIII